MEEKKIYFPFPKTYDILNFDFTLAKKNGKAIDKMLLPPRAAKE